MMTAKRKNDALGRCVFCGNRSPDGENEHFPPRWLVKHTGPPGRSGHKVYYNPMVGERLDHDQVRGGLRRIDAYDRFLRGIPPTDDGVGKLLRTPWIFDEQQGEFRFADDCFPSRNRKSE